MNKKLILSLALSGLVLTTAAQTKVTPAIPQDAKMEQQIEKLLKKMTLDEKVGQMCELTIDLLQDRKANPSNGFRLSEAMLDSVIGKYKVGSILNVPNGIAQTPAKWQEIIKRIQEKSIKEIGIPCVYGVDQIHGTTYTLGGTFFPQGINMGAAFNRELTRRGAEISAYETKAGSIPWTYAPVTDLGRDPRWPRQWENYGEDCYLNAEMGREAVIGFQGNDPNHIGTRNVAACMKHFMGYGAPVSGKDRTPSSITVQDMREKHFAPYLEMVRNGALSVMVNSAMNNGLPFHANYELLTKWLKEDLEWDGMIVTDWADIDNLWKRDHIAKDKKEAIKLAINAGIDMSMDPYDWRFCPLLKELVQEGEVPMSRIDDAVRRVLRLKYRLNLFEKPYYDLKDFPLFGGKQHAAAALQAAEESLVLLKNTDAVLPLAKGKKILLTGPNANSMRCLNGGWSYTWQGSNAEACAEPYNTILEAFTNKFGADHVIYEAGVTYNDKGNWWEENTPQIEKAVAAAAKADYIVACIGENSYCETPGNLTNLFLSENQLDLVKALAKTGKPVILILSEGRPRIISDIEPLAKAVVDVMLPGNYGGDALANLIAGDANFSGKLPFTYPKEINSLITYDYKPCEHIGKQMEGAYNYDAQVSVQWAFGYGLSYTTFAYSNLKVNKPNFSANDELIFTVDVKNTGNCIGKESVLLFSSDLIASLTPDNRRLRAFEKVELNPGESKTVTLKLKASDLAFVGYDGKWILEKGDFRIQAGSQVMNVVCTDTKKWETPNKQ
ncbi:glycoside hydrolase family 3 N-terminal domain-containing protein [Bacteroides helcogenes]|uniref:beta-glucosidase n=1 Tax=Bacteroides helcogenes (strain ATCC 35417 / DSM 20613 / JCM 6297 / CCUG 15421 / P 36-108) TaxID=693979 RepID=E6SW22_BACT6|nr:glycoside hydrolase family 3 N-terminal domain-containing protein [Bacteroides helcogenes]ADV42547.1 glycoside hydrolase family 3 domain protein [Bacteroides helcogenes P 36-108]MDY5237692.1 glycoside hydrolase family 3 N-terminal domain-containing protein [Bacteroides helcogenes]